MISSVYSRYVIPAAGDCLAFDLSAPRDCAFANPPADEPARYLVSLVRR